jgi:hypothetical protein
VDPLSGAGHIDLTITSQSGFAGVFQDVPNLTPGSSWTFSGWHQASSNPYNVVSEVRIEWRNSVSDTEITRTPNLLPVAGTDYTPFSLTAIVPAGADTARAVYALATFATTPPAGGTVYLDDFSFRVPEPSAMTLLSLAGLGLVGMRRRLAS